MYLTRVNNSNWLPTILNDWFSTDFMPQANVNEPALNVIERDNEYTVELAAPGMTKDDFKITINEDQNLVVTMEKKHTTESKNERYLRRGFSHQRYQQTFLLSEEMNVDKISANMANGILSIDIPKKSKEELKKATKFIEIN